MKKYYELRKKICAAGKRQGWWDAPGLVVALSGGGDSVAMLWLLREFYGGRLVAAHLDHCTREGASHDDARFAEDLCAAWGITCAVKRVEVYANRLPGESFEMAGRRERYLHFSETANSEGLSFIAVGHNADDLVETQLINLFRGTGLAGLRGIPELRGDIVRPVIDFTRAELRAILQEQNLAWREDLSNSETIYVRNRIREELIPWVKENMNPNFESGMLGLARQVEDELVYKNAVVQKNIEAVVQDIPPALACWSAKKLASFSDLELTDMLREQGKRLELPTLSRDRTEKLTALIRRRGAWRFQWAYDIEVCYSERGVGWLHRADVENAEKNTEKSPKKQTLPWWARGSSL